MKILGWIIICAGAIWLIDSMMMETSLPASDGGRISNLSLIARQQNGIIISVAIIIGGLLCVLLRTRSAVASGIKCPFCAELIKPEAVICKHCKSKLPVSAPDNNQSKVFTEIQKFNYQDFLDTRSVLLEPKIIEFSRLGVLYLDEVRLREGDLDAAENHLIARIKELASMFSETDSEEFLLLCEKHSPWMVLR